MNKLLIVWKSENDIDIYNFITPFAVNSVKQKWFDHVEILIWGASTHKILTDDNAKDKVKLIVDAGVTAYACKYCADQVGASELLESLGVTVVYTGVYLSDKLKDPEYEVLTI